MSLPSILTLFLLLLPLRLTANSEVELQVNPRMTTEATNVKIIIERHENNRHLWLIWGLAPGLENRKYFQIDGAQRTRVFDYMIQFTEKGTWEVKAVLERNDGETFSQTTTVEVH